MPIKNSPIDSPSSESFNPNGTISLGGGAPKSLECKFEDEGKKSVPVKRESSPIGSSAYSANASVERFSEPLVDNTSHSFKPVAVKQEPRSSIESYYQYEEKVSSASPDVADEASASYPNFQCVNVKEETSPSSPAAISTGSVDVLTENTPDSSAATGDASHATASPSKSADASTMTDTLDSCFAEIAAVTQQLMDNFAVINDKTVEQDLIHELIKEKSKENEGLGMEMVRITELEEAKNIELERKCAALESELESMRDELNESKKQFREAWENMGTIREKFEKRDEQENAS
eukprot:CAMPEP_0183742664 /NCGR_PEP_ID=MMETSP0737-20130205/64818_1 /TAXON_ID=385413 /ORGANISM="Thalassiosira miniscula, Strain CCMP1093" /LENGTH=291 /DNA_ID=CAMNT_0025978255 /DNA_START=2443 /DNA_END=3318 /DNA_ORIENTATION=+